LRRVAETNNLTMPQLAAELADLGIKVVPASISRWFRRQYATAPFGHWLTQTSVAGLRCYELIVLWVIDGPMTHRIFETYVETQLAPTLSKGDVVILDNLPAHKISHR
jgi:hypothetical protein